METCTWSIITFVNNARTILRQLKQRAISKYLLQSFFLRIESFFASNSIKIGSNKIEPYFQAEKSLKLFFKKVWENLPPLWIISEVKLKETLSTS